MVFLLLASWTAVAQAGGNLVLAKGARVGIVNLLDAEVTQFHMARALPDSFMKTQSVSWHVDQMLGTALRDRFQELGLVQVPLPPSDAMTRGREECLLRNSPAKGFSRECSAPFAQLAASERLDAIIVLGPGLNDSAHGRRRKELPAYLRGWGFVSGGEGNSHGKPSLFNMTELLAIGISGESASVRAREWGGTYELEWSSFVPPPDLRAVPVEQLDQLSPLFAQILTRQCGRLLDQLEVQR
jgi:hypothetical protein